MMEAQPTRSPNNIMCHFIDTLTTKPILMCLNERKRLLQKMPPISEPFLVKDYYKKCQLLSLKPRVCQYAHVCEFMVNTYIIFSLHLHYTHQCV